MYHYARGVMVQGGFVATRVLTAPDHVDILLQKRINVHGALEVESSAVKIVVIAPVHLDMSLQRSFSAFGVEAQGSFAEAHAIIVPIQGAMLLLRDCNVVGVLELECSVDRDATIVVPRVLISEEELKKNYSRNAVNIHLHHQIAG